MSNFGTATVPSSDSRTVTFTFNEERLAPGVTVATIRGICTMDLTQNMSWPYPLDENPFNLTATCDNGPYVFEAVTSEGRRIAFPFSIEVSSPTYPGKYDIANWRVVSQSIIIRARRCCPICRSCCGRHVYPDVCVDPGCGCVHWCPQCAGSEQVQEV